MTSDRSALAEVAGDAALLVDPEDVGAISAGLERVLTDDAFRAELAAKGLEHARTFTWQHTARKTLDALRRVAAAKARA